MISWLIGTFGAGRTTTARHLVSRLANAQHFDPEGPAPWRELVLVFTEKVAGFTGQHLIAVQTVLRGPAVGVFERIAVEAEKRIGEANQAQMRGQHRTVTSQG